MTMVTERQPAMRRLVVQAIRAHRLLQRGDRVLVAVSGGADSVALLSVLHELAPSFDLTLKGVHLNHGLRGEESDTDEKFVVDLCRRLGIPCLCTSLSFPSDARHGASRQAAARTLRYQTLETIQRREGWTKVALGHTLDDQAETVLLWLLRGTGTRGLAGIPWTRPPGFIRPLLEVTRRQILQYLGERGLAHREDSSNRTVKYRRNLVRHRILPLFREVNPSIVEVLARQAAILRDEDRYLDHTAAGALQSLTAEEASGQLVLHRDLLLLQPLALQRRIVRQALQRVSGTAYPPSLAAVSETLRCAGDLPSGSSAVLAGIHVSHDYDKLRILRLTDGGEFEGRLPSIHQEESVALPVPSMIDWPATRQRISADLVHWDRKEPFCMDHDPLRAMVDADRLTLTLNVRGWRRGDRFCPLGLGGRQKKLQDLFTDRRVPRDLRHRVPLVVAPEGIVWVVGHHLDHRFRVTDSTTRVLRLTVSEQTATVAKEKP